MVHSPCHFELPQAQFPLWAGLCCVSALYHAWNWLNVLRLELLGRGDNEHNSLVKTVPNDRTLHRSQCTESLIPALQSSGKVGKKCQSMYGHTCDYCQRLLHILR